MKAPLTLLILHKLMTSLILDEETNDASDHSHSAMKVFELKMESTAQTPECSWCLFQSLNFDLYNTRAQSESFDILTFRHRN